MVITGSEIRILLIILEFKITVFYLIYFEMYFIPVMSNYIFIHSSSLQCLMIHQKFDWFGAHILTFNHILAAFYENCDASFKIL